MASKVTPTQINTLMSRFVKNYKDKYGDAPTNFNRHREKWAFQGMIEDLGMTRAAEVVDYYFETRHIGHPVSNLLYNYDKLNQLMKDRAADDEARAKLRRESEQRVKEWREKHGK